MKKFKNYALALTGLLILTAATSLINSGHTGAQTPTPPTQVRNIDNPALQPFQAFLCGRLIFPDGVQHPTWQADFPLVPEGKRFVIEYVTAKAHLVPDQRFNPHPEIDQISVTTTVANATGAHFLVPLDQTRSGQDRVVLSLQVKGLYADPATKFSISARSDSSLDANHSSVCFSISGYLVDVPSQIPVELP
jgi:hypothetical protein